MKKDVKQVKKMVISHLNLRVINLMILDCFFYSPELQILFGLIEHYVPNYNRFNKKKKLDLILNGVNIDNEEYLSTNTTLTKAVQNFILSTKRFTVIED